ncbi:MAG TPA: class I SAM-dependent methyltransferase, partial [Verrucomicrobiae bacterium]|nr:class I SAM-dependent methyltransferase [Verrucomicrobiae bacterium]
GTGAWSDRLIRHGFRDVTGIDLNQGQFQGGARFVEGDLNSDFSQLVGGAKFELITAIEVIEHLENSSHFLRECAALLAPGGALVITTPNVESMPARIKHFASGRIRHFDANGDKTHIAPIDSFLFRRLAARAGLTVCDHVGLVRYWHDNRVWFRALSAVLAPFLKGMPYGACHLFRLQRTAR